MLLFLIFFTFLQLPQSLESWFMNVDKTDIVPAKQTKSSCERQKEVLNESDLESYLLLHSV